MTFGANKETIESKKRLTDIDPSLGKHVRKGDFSIVANHYQHLVFALESKSEHNKRQSKEDVIKKARNTQEENYNLSNSDIFL